MTKARDSADKAPVAVVTDDALGTPTSGTLTNATGLPPTGVVGTAVVTDGVLGTPTSGTLTNLTGLPPAGVVGTAAILGANTFTGTQEMPAVKITTGAGASKILTSDASGAGTWQAPAAGGTNGWHLLSTINASAAATVDIETTLDGTYDTYVILAETSAGAGEYRCRLKVSGVYLTGASNYAYLNTATLSSTNSTIVTNAVTADSIQLMGTGWINTQRSNFEFTISNVDAGGFKSLQWKGTQALSNQIRGHRGEGGALSTGVITGVRLYANAATISGTFRLYGIAKS